MSTQSPSASGGFAKGIRLAGEGPAAAAVATTGTESGVRPGRTANVIGPIISRLRYQRNWTQDMLAARLQLQGLDITRDVVANLESRRSVATDRQILALLKVFRIKLVELFPPGVDAETKTNGAPAGKGPVTGRLSGAQTGPLRSGDIAG